MSKMTAGLVDIATPNLTLGGITTHEIDPDVVEWLGGSASVDNQHAATMNVKPRLGFTTYDLPAALAVCGIAGCVIADLDLYELLYDDHGEIKSGAVHPKTSLADGIMVPRQISFGGGDDPVTVAFEAFGTASDGETVPISQTTASAPAGGGVAQAFTLAKITFGGSAIDEINNLTFDFGLGVDHRVLGGDLCPRIAPINARDPLISLTSEDHAVASTFGFVGSEGAVTLYFQKLSSAGRVAPATLAHVGLTITNAYAKATARSGTHRQATGLPVEIRPIIDGANPILAVATGIAIP
ncbi:MAG: hypothetical protein KAV00_10500 [Phycisphaerae bacterium]|nr:hypothetical protein [Phycisphaerae bacterium]